MHAIAGALTGLTLSALLLSPAAAEIKVGVAASLTGQFAFTGGYTQLTMEMAVADLNAKGGVLGQKLRIVLADDQCDAEAAMIAARKLVAEGVAVVFGHDCSGAAIPASDVYEAAGILFFSGFATNPRLTERGLHHVFRAAGRDDQQAILAADYLIARYPGEPIAIVHDTLVYGHGLAEEVREELHRRGVEEVLFEAVQPGQLEYSQLVTRMQKSHVSVIYFAGYVDEAGLLVRQAWEAGLKVPMVTGDGTFAEHFPIVAGPEAASATVTANFPNFSLYPETAAVVERLGVIGFDPINFGFQLYAAAQAWAEAVARAQTTEAGMVAAALRRERFATVIGEIGFDAKGDIIGLATWIWWTWRDGKQVPLVAEK